MNEEVKEILVEKKSPKKNIILVFVVIGVMIVCGIFFWSRSPREINQTTDIQTGKIIALSEISPHNSKESCWTVINGEVFDVTKFVSKHKGGDKILAVCGIDGTDLFTGKSPMGRVHSQIAVKLLGSMKIGQLQ